MSHAAQVLESFVVFESEHPLDECAQCREQAEQAKTSALVTGSLGATQVLDGRGLKEPYYHFATVKRPSRILFS